MVLQKNNSLVSYIHVRVDLRKKIKAGDYVDLVELIDPKQIPPPGVDAGGITGIRRTSQRIRRISPVKSGLCIDPVYGPDP